MTSLRPLWLPLLAAGTLGTARRTPLTHGPVPTSAAARRCTLVPGRALALVRVERDTTLAFAPVDVGALSLSGVPQSPADSDLAVPGTPMPAARVRLLQVDSATRAALARAGVSGDQPAAFVHAAPYRADCRTVRWADTTRWVVPGEVGYVRASLAAPEQWVGGVPVLVVTDTWNYPYPRQRGLAYGAAPGAAPAPAEAMFGLHAALDASGVAPASPFGWSDAARRERALRWAAAHPVEAELDPVRAIVRDAVLAPDFDQAQRLPSRLGGTYRATVEGDGVRGAWYFRTDSRPSYGWAEAGASRTTAELVASPYVSGYRLVGHAAGARDSLPTAWPQFGVRTSPALVWLASADRPTAPGNAERRVLRAMLEFTLAAAPAPLWDVLEPFVPPRTASERPLYERTGNQVDRARRQPRLPLTLRLDAGGTVRGDTTLTAGGRTLRVRLERVDTLALRRPY